jgi:hypothetical protein
MDPDICLENCKEIVAEIIKCIGVPYIEGATLERLATELAENFHNLDEWITKGGFLPAAWKGDI